MLLSFGLTVTKFRNFDGVVSDKPGSDLNNAFRFLLAWANRVNWVIARLKHHLSPGIQTVPTTYEEYDEFWAKETNFATTKVLSDMNNEMPRPTGHLMGLMRTPVGPGISNPLHSGNTVTFRKGSAGDFGPGGRVGGHLG